MLFAGNTVSSISERVRGVCVDALYKSTFTLFTYLQHEENGKTNTVDEKRKYAIKRFQAYTAIRQCSIEAR